MTNFKLGFFCLGNGTTLVNEALNSCPSIGHVSTHGVIDIWVPESEIPNDAKESIKEYADGERKKFLALWNTMDAFQKFQYMYKIPTIGGGFNPMQKVNIDNLDKPFDEREKMMEDVFFKTSM